VKTSLNKKVTRDFSVLVYALGVDEDDLLDYFNWCLLEQLVTTFSEDKNWISSLRAVPNGLAQFKKAVEMRTRLRWDVENISRLYDRVTKATEKHYKKPITYEELIRLLINSPLRCSNPLCGKSPPKVKLHIDHTLPASKGGDSKFENLKFLCERCNLSKSDTLERTDIWLTLESLQPF
jgi:5-methylcytosine-specific restriction endonuclease McrA